MIKKKGEECKQTPPTYWRNQSVGFWMVLSGHPACSSQIVAPEAKRRAHPSTQNTQQVNIPTSLKEVGLSKTLAANPPTKNNTQVTHLVNQQPSSRSKTDKNNKSGWRWSNYPASHRNQPTKHFLNVTKKHTTSPKSNVKVEQQTLYRKMIKPRLFFFTKSD